MTIILFIRIKAKFNDRNEFIGITKTKKKKAKEEFNCRNEIIGTIKTKKKKDYRGRNWFDNIVETKKGPILAMLARNKRTSPDILR